MATFSERIKMLRTEMNMSLRQLSKITDISPSAIHAYEMGTREPGYKSLDSLCKAFNCSISYILGKTDERNNKKSGMKIGSRLDQSFSQNVRFYRTEANLSTKDMADLIGVDEDTILSIERGEYKIDKETIFRICDILHITPDILDGIITERLEQGDIDAEYCFTRFPNPPTIHSSCPTQTTPPLNLQLFASPQSGETEKPAEDSEPSEDVIIYHRNGKTVKREFTKEQMDMLISMIEAIPEKPKDI